MNQLTDSVTDNEIIALYIVVSFACGALFVDTVRERERQALVCFPQTYSETQ